MPSHVFGVGCESDDRGVFVGLGRDVCFDIT